MIKLDVSVGIIERPNGDVVLVQRDYSKSYHPLSGKYHLPAGKHAPDELPIETLFREMKEETGLNVAVKREMGLTKNGHRHFSFYLCNPENPEQKPVPGKGTADALYVPKNMLLTYLTDPYALSVWPLEVADYLELGKF